MEEKKRGKGDRTQERINEKIRLVADKKETEKKRKQKESARQLHDGTATLWLSKEMVVKVGKS